MNLLLCHVSTVLRGQDNSIQPNRSALLVVFHRHLCLAVRPQIGERAVLSDLCKAQGQLVRQCDGIRHELRRLIGGIAEHHTLITGSDGFDLTVVHLVLFGLQRLVDTHGNIRGLFVDRCDHCTGVGVETIFSPGITDLPHCIPHDLLNIHISVGRDLSHDQHKSCGRTGLTRHAAHGILRHQRIQDRIRDLIAHFVRMTFCYRF